MEIIESDPLRFLAGIIGYSLPVIFFSVVFIMPVAAMTLLVLEKITGVEFDWEKPKKFLTYKLYFMLVMAFSIYLSYTNLERSIINKQYREQKRQECIESPICQDNIALRKSRISDSPVVSTTGNYFYNGVRCSNQCIGLFSGYNWAKDRGITKELGCDSLQAEWFEGCLMYVEEESYLYD